MPADRGGGSDALYVGEVMHHRVAPVRHRFVYRVFSLLLDIDNLPSLDRRLRLFSVNRPNLISFYDRDHGARDGSPLRPWVMQELARAGLQFECGQILLFCFPRIWGYVFNPISLYFCYDMHGHLGAILCEVKNTFGDQHPYVLPVDRDAVDRDAVDREKVRQSANKAMYVSPFIEMAARYQFRITSPADNLSLMISEWGGEGSRLVALLRAKRSSLSDRSLAWAALKDPVMSLKVIVGIHFEALVLWLKGAALKERPEQTAALAHAGRNLDDGDRCRAR